MTGSGSKAANVVRNGGDILVCAAAPGATLVGPLVLDYVVEASSQPGGAASLSSETFNDLAARYHLTVPEIGDELDEFAGDAALQLWGNGPSPGSRFLWQPSALGLLTLNDQDLMRDADVSTPLPANCYTTTPSGRQILLKQAVIREETPATRGITLRYDPTALGLIQTDDQQFSFLMMHEWLWEHAENAVTVRAINWFLHTQAARAMKPTDLVFQLATMGFHFSGRNPGAATIPINIAQPGISEPNGRPRFVLPEYVVVGPASTKVVIRNDGNQTYWVRLVTEAASPVVLCPVLTTSCEVDLTTIASFPAVIDIEREPLLDPLWDAKFLMLVR